MKVVQTKLEGVFVIEPTVYEDDRGFFMESFNKRAFNAAVGREVEFVQDNHSKSSMGVLRGLHYQIKNTQGKLVRVTCGSVFDVAVDLRKGSVTYGDWVGFELSAKNKRQLWIPEGFAHGFLTLESNVEFLYKTTDYYSPEYERTILWNDPELKINWPEIDVEYTLSEKDKNGLFFNKSEVFE
ncbi:dTDP-4-dehydrorhamnose 3,5-epimerase [Pontibacterium sp.]|uniref:dTDP-4-dehydrorhamnose 3,5-epimerase n=1 Tax=Pontibacterium sp. TaxID=2036026 RepID=UPI0035112758